MAVKNPSNSEVGATGPSLSDEGASEESRMVRCTVAPGHTVVTGLPPNRWEDTPGSDKKRQVRVGTQKYNGPGTIIDLPQDEYEHNLERGFVLDPEGRERVPNGLGPIFDRDTTANPGGVGGQNTMITTVGR
jgi:hypothetical protein